MFLADLSEASSNIWMTATAQITWLPVAVAGVRVAQTVTAQITCVAFTGSGLPACVIKQRPKGSFSEVK